MTLQWVMRIRVVHFCGMGLGGTEKTAQIFCRHLDRASYEVFVAGIKFRPQPGDYLKARAWGALGVPRYRSRLSQWKANNARIPLFREVVGADHLLLAPTWEELKPALLNIRPDILHIHYSGDPGPPISDEETMSTVPITVTTNVFNNENTSPQHRKVARMLFISHELRRTAVWARDDSRSRVLYYPIETPYSQDNLRAELGIPADAFIVGRTGRPSASIHHPISLRAYRQIQTPNTWFVALAPPLVMEQEARALGLSRFVSLAPRVDDTWLSKYYNTIDVLAHARRDGETFGCNIAEAMMHGKPVVSHRSPLANAQEEIIGDTGFVTGHDDDAAYAGHLLRLRDDVAFRRELGEKARQRALACFDALRITRQLEAIYDEVRNEAGVK
jgi:glycosyltransferase involved in cell wall biosynthesis